MRLVLGMVRPDAGRVEVLGATVGSRVDRVTVIHAGRIVGELDPHGTELGTAFFAMVHQADLASGAGSAA